jgi:hypothetical protein
MRTVNNAQSDSGCGCWFLFLVFLGFLVWACFDSRLRYSLQYSVWIGNVTIAPKPHNCEWATAPIGNKNCSYQAEVSAVRTGFTADRKPIFSLDNGQTWQWDNAVPPTEPSVSVYWRKVEE